MEEVYTVKVRAKPDAARLYPSERRYSASTVGGLGAVHLALALTCILLTGLDMAQPSTSSSGGWALRYGGGAWLAIAAAMAGFAGILAWRRWYIDNNIRWFFIFSCIAGVTAVLCLIVTSAALAVTQEEWTSNRLRVLASIRDAHAVPHAPESLSLHVQTKSPLDMGHSEIQRSQRGVVVTPTNNNNLPSQIHSACDEQKETERSNSFLSVPQEIGSVSQVPSSETHTNRMLSHSSESLVPDHENSSYDNLQPLPESNTNMAPTVEEMLALHNIPIQREVNVPVIVGASISPNRPLSESTNIHHVSKRQAADQSVDIKYSGQEYDSGVTNEETTHGSRNPEVNHQSTKNSRIISLTANDTITNRTGVMTEKSIFEEYWITSHGRDLKLVIAINLLVACILEIGWSILSAKIAWKGMRNGYPEDGPPRIDSSQNPIDQSQLKDKSKIRNKKLGTLRKPDIISNHDESKTSSRRKDCREERKDPSLPMRESTMEYQERVRRFLASNTVANIDNGLE